MTKNESDFGIYVTPNDTLKFNYATGQSWRLTKAGWAVILHIDAPQRGPGIPLVGPQQ